MTTMKIFSRIFQFSQNPADLQEVIIRLLMEQLPAILLYKANQ
ncbi:hypothetical protein BDFB_006263 [Asbolus verrucosus]|uniref:Uncharacterized protein n=1 Tax=Asbolus verrucosus TaxID=1661398 RepID=A0A482VCW5_ASBVE|nr:hypothetical protein BDFB_006263 [Asbolus verrucosus]